MGAEVAIKQYDEERSISPTEVRKFIAPTATDKELYMFLNICKAYGLNPFKREIHFIKYSKQEQASIVVGYEVYIKRAERSGKLDGWRVDVADDAQKATVTIYRKDWQYPFEWTVYKEEVDRAIPGKKNPWAIMPKFMMAKTAIGQGFRLCFSEELGGMPYLPEEMPETANYNINDNHVIEAEEVESEEGSEPEPEQNGETRQEDISILLQSVHAFAADMAITHQQLHDWMVKQWPEYKSLADLPAAGLLKMRSSLEKRAKEAMQDDHVSLIAQLANDAGYASIDDEEFLTWAGNLPQIRYALPEGITKLKGYEGIAIVKALRAKIKAMREAEEAQAEAATEIDAEEIPMDVPDDFFGDDIPEGQVRQHNPPK